MRKRTFILIAILGFIFHHALMMNDSKRLKWPDAFCDYYSATNPGLDVADIVSSHHTGLHSAITATGIDMIVPDGYEQSALFQKFYRDKDTSIAIEQIAGSFYDHKQAIDDYLDAPADGSSHREKLLYRKSFKFNNYDAMIVCVADQTSQRTSLFMSFGNQNFNVNMRGICKADDDKALHEMLYTFLTACYETKQFS